jgi:Leucine-rich repeat (LRR) protein
VTDISLLASLTGLEELNLNVNEITDLSPLSSLVNLKRLLFYANTVTDITPLSSLVNLAELDISLNKIPDISPLLNLTGLKKLSFNYLGINTGISRDDARVILAFWDVIGELQERGVNTGWSGNPNLNY